MYSIIDLSFTRFQLVPVCQLVLVIPLLQFGSSFDFICSSSFQLKSTNAAEYVELKPGDCPIDNATVSSGAAKGDIQKKITPWSNPGSVVVELFPGSTSLSPPPHSYSGGRKDLVQSHRHTGGETEREEGGLVLVASLLNKLPNLGGE